MALNPYTLNHLYEKGILDYVPTELMMGAPMGTMSVMNNPYLDMAKQGGLYQNHGAAVDSFHSSFTPAYTPQYPQNVSAGSNYGYRYNSNTSGIGGYNQNSISSSFGMNGVIGSQSNAGITNTFSGYGVGVNNQNGILNSLGGGNSVGSQSNAGGLGTFGGFTDVENNINSGVNKVNSFVDRTPKFILGIAATAIGIIGLRALFKRGKKPVKTGETNSFWSKLNPMNWRKNK